MRNWVRSLYYQQLFDVTCTQWVHFCNKNSRYRQFIPGWQSVNWNQHVSFHRLVCYAFCFLFLFPTNNTQYMILRQTFPNIGCFYGFFYVVRKREGRWRICSHESSAIITFRIGVLCWTHWPRGLRFGSAVNRFLPRLPVWIQLRACMYVCLLWVLCFVRSGWSLVQRSPIVCDV